MVGGCGDEGRQLPLGRPEEGPDGFTCYLRGFAGQQIMHDKSRAVIDNGQVCQASTVRIDTEPA